MAPLVSVVIPTYNEERDILNCLNSLLNQSLLNFEIIVVDDGSTDKTREMVYSMSNKKIRLEEGKHKGPGYSRNIGAKIAKGKILVFVDADMTFNSDYLKNLIQPILDGKTYGTEDGKQVASNPENIWSRCWGTYFKEYINPTEGQIFRAILKSKFKLMKGFDPSLGYADDLTFYLKYNAKSLRVPNAICHHKNPSTLKEVYKQSKWIGSSMNLYFLNNILTKWFIPPVAIILSPVAILYLSVKKAFTNKTLSILFPWMFIFMTVRYFGAVNGILRKVYLGLNVR